MPLLGSIKLSPVPLKIDPMRCMGDWYVQRMIPASSLLEGPAHNGKETYTWDEENNRVKVRYVFRKGSFTGPEVVTTQRGSVVEDPNGYGTHWAVRPHLGFIGLPFHLPFSLGYYILDIDTEHYSFLTCAAPDGSWMYVMTRRQEVPDEYLEPTLTKLELLGFNMKKVLTLPQQGDGGMDKPLPHYPGAPAPATPKKRSHRIRSVDDILPAGNSTRDAGDDDAGSKRVAKMPVEM